MRDTQTPGHRLLPAAGLFFLATAVYMITYSGLFRSLDELTMFAQAERLLRGLPGAPPQLIFAAEAFDYSATFELLQILILAPLYLLGTYSGQLGSIQTVMLLNVWVTAAAVAFVWLALNEMGLSRGASLFGALAFAFATMVWPYSRTLFRQSGALLLLAASLYFYLRYARSGSRGFGAACLLSQVVSAGIRAETVATLLVFAVAIVWRSRSSATNRHIFTIAAATLVLGAIVSFWNLLSRSFGPGPANPLLLFHAATASGVFQESLQRIFGMTLSPGKGLFIYSPVLLLGIVGLPLLWRRDRGVAGLAITLLGIYLVLFSLQPWGGWWGGVAWGPRFLVPLAAPLILPAALLFDQGRTWRRALVAVGGLSSAIQVVASSADFSVYYQELVATFRPPYEGYLENEILLSWGNASLSPVLGQFSIWRPEHFDILWWRSIQRGGPAVLQPALLIILLVLVLIALAVLADSLRLPRPQHTRRVLAGGGVAFAVGTYLFLRLAYQVPSSYPEVDTPSLRAIATEISAAPGRRLLVSVSNAFQYNALMNFLKGDMVHYWLSPSQREGFDILHSPLEDAQQVYLVLDHIAPGSPDEEAALFWLHDHAHYISERWFGGYRFYEFAPPLQDEIQWTRLKIGPETRGLIPERVDVVFEDQIKLWGYDLLTPDAGEGDSVYLTLLWEALAQPEKDYILSLQIMGPAERVLGQVDVHPGRPSHPTSEWKPGEVVAETYAVPLWHAEFPSGAWIQATLYDWKTLERLQAVDPSGNSVGRVLLGPLKIGPRAFPRYTVPNPVQFNLNNEIELMGYEIHPAAIQSGDSVSLTLYWRALVSPDKDYTVFTHLIDDQDRIWGQQDNPPVNGYYPTSLWEPGEIVRDEYLVPVDASFKPGTYRVEVGMYRSDSGQRLPALNKDGVLADDRILLPAVLSVVNGS